MIVKNDSVTFEPCDMPFTRKFGCDEAAKMVLDFKAFHPKLPFLYDTHQLADFLKTGRKTLFDLTNHPEACYSTVSVPKKSGGTRTLNVPNDRLKAISDAAQDPLRDPCVSSGLKTRSRLSQGRTTDGQRRGTYPSQVSFEA